MIWVDKIKAIYTLTNAKVAVDYRSGYKIHYFACVTEGTKKKYTQRSFKFDILSDSFISVRLGHTISDFRVLLILHSKTDVSSFLTSTREMFRINYDRLGNRIILQVRRDTRLPYCTVHLSPFLFVAFTSA